jgi:hypothetical protein
MVQACGVQRAAVRCGRVEGAEPGVAADRGQYVGFEHGILASPRPLNSTFGRRSKT